MEGSYHKTGKKEQNKNPAKNAKNTYRIIFHYFINDKYRLLILVFSVIYFFLISLSLSQMAVQWDEVNHLTGGLHLIRGDFLQYFLTSSFYPPMFNLFTAFYFTVFGVSVFSARLVALTFYVLSLFAVYEIAKQMYKEKTALLSVFFFALMPGFVWLSRIALIETMLVFIFTVCTLFFFRWIKTGREKDLTASMVAFAIGGAVKYQILVVIPIVLLAGMIVFGKKDYLKSQITRILTFPRVLAPIALIVIAASAIVTLYFYGLLDVVWFAIQTGTAERALSSARFPAPVFYFIEMAWPPSGLHPVSILVYGTSLVGLAFFAIRRSMQDKFLLVVFAVIFAVFSLIPNKEWRYVIMLFPVFAISASNLILSVHERLKNKWKTSNIRRLRLVKFGSILLIAFTIVSLLFSYWDTQNFLGSAPEPLPLEQVADYIAPKLVPNQTVVVACPVNLIEKYMVWFYLNTKTSSQNEVWQYPAQAADAYTPVFEIEEFKDLCYQNNTKYVLLYEYDNINYFNASFGAKNVQALLEPDQGYEFEEAFGNEPNRIFLYLID